MSIIEDLSQIKELCMGGQYSKALSIVNSALKRNPNYPPALSYKSSILSNMNKYDQAYEVMSLAISIDPLNARYLGKMAKILIKLNPNPSDEKRNEIQGYLERSFNRASTHDADTFRYLLPLFLKIEDNYHAKQCESLIKGEGGIIDTHNEIEATYKNFSVSNKSPASQMSLNDPIQREIFSIMQTYLPKLINEENWESRMKAIILDLYRGEKDVQFNMIINLLNLKITDRLINDIKMGRPDPVIKRDLKNKLKNQGYDLNIIEITIDFWIKTVNNLNII